MARQKLEQYKDLLECFGTNKKFMAKLNSKLRQLEVARKEERQAAAREREAKVIEERNQRNLERMKQKEHVVANIYKRATYRSPQPARRVFTRKVDQTKDEQDFLKYLGAEFEITEDQISESKKLASQGSMRSMSVPSIRA